MKGGHKALWVDETISTTITEKSVDFIHRNAIKPFFLNCATNDIHVPRVPNPQFVGLSGMEPRGDAILEFDWSVGEIAHALEIKGVGNNTILIIPSDNGPVVDDGIRIRQLQNWENTLHGVISEVENTAITKPVPVYWADSLAKEIPQGKVSNAQLSQVDLFASFAALTATSLESDEAPDSQNLLNAILGKEQAGREYIIEHDGSLTLIEYEWKYILSDNEPAYDRKMKIDLGNSPVAQLYNLSIDIGEKNNVAGSYPDKVKELEAKLQTEISKTAKK